MVESELVKLNEIEQTIRKYQDELQMKLSMSHTKDCEHARLRIRLGDDDAPRREIGFYRRDPQGRDVGFVERARDHLLIAATRLPPAAGRHCCFRRRSPRRAASPPRSSRRP